MKNRPFTMLAVACGFLMAATPLLAHHGEAAYDVTNTVTVKGTVSAFEFVNPHVQVLFDVTDDRGNTQKWVGEAASPNMLTREGWDKRSLKPGDRITAIGLRSKRASNLILLEKLVLSNGQEINPQARWKGSRDRASDEGNTTLN